MTQRRFRVFSSQVTVYHVTCNDCGSIASWVWDHGGTEARREWMAEHECDPAVIDRIGEIPAD